MRYQVTEVSIPGLRLSFVRASTRVKFSQTVGALIDWSLDVLEGVGGGPLELQNSYGLAWGLGFGYKGIRMVENAESMNNEINAWFYGFYKG